MTQDTFQFGNTHDAEFRDWKEKPGAGHVLRDIYALAAGYVAYWRRYSIPVSVKLLCEIERQRIKTRRARYRRWYKRDLPKSKGYTINNSLTGSIARHIVARRPDWDGLFEFRERRA